MSDLMVESQSGYFGLQARPQKPAAPNGTLISLGRRNSVGKLSPAIKDCCKKKTMVSGSRVMTDQLENVRALYKSCEEPIVALKE